MKSQFGKLGSKRRSKIRSGVNAIRYADDFIISGITREVLEYEVKPLVSCFLQERGLILSKEKTSPQRITLDKESLLYGSETTPMAFCCTHMKNNLKEINYLRLLRLTDIPIRRHVKIRADANPLDFK